MQHYKGDVSSEQREALLELMKHQSHPAITSEIRRELQHAKCRDVEPMAHWGIRASWMVAGSGPLSSTLACPIFWTVYWICYVRIFFISNALNTLYLKSLECHKWHTWNKILDSESFSLPSLISAHLPDCTWNEMKTKQTQASLHYLSRKL